MLKKLSICDGYCQTLKYILDELKIPCIKVVGHHKFTNGPHAWNYVQCNGKWYFVQAQGEIGTKLTLKGKNNIISKNYKIDPYLSTGEKNLLQKFNVPTICDYDLI